MRFVKPSSATSVKIERGGLDIASTYTWEESHLTAVAPEITGGKRWAAFRIKSDPLNPHSLRSWVHVGVVPSEDLLTWGHVGWTCLDDTPRSAAEHAANTCRFIGLGDGCLCGSGYGVGFEGDELQPEGFVPQFDSDGRCTTAFNEGDVVGVLVDCIEQFVRFFKNGEKLGPGYTAGVTPPLTFAVNIFLHGKISLLPDEPPPCYCCGTWDSTPAPLCVSCQVSFFLGGHARAGVSSPLLRLQSKILKWIVRHVGEGYIY